MDTWAPAIVLGSIGSRRAGARKRRPRPRFHVVGDVYSAGPSNSRSSEMHSQFRSTQSSVCLPPAPLVARHDVDLVPTWTLTGAAVGASVLARSMSAQAEEQWRFFCQRDQHPGCSDRPQMQLQRLSRGVNMLLSHLHCIQSAGHSHTACGYVAATPHIASPPPAPHRGAPASTECARRIAGTTKCGWRKVCDKRPNVPRSPSAAATVHPDGQGSIQPAAGGFAPFTNELTELQQSKRTSGN